MMKLSSSRLTVAILAAATVILVAGGAAIASNMGFKLNKPIVIQGVGQIGANWTSIPYNNPYGSAGGFCVQTGLVSTGLTGKGAITFLNEITGLPTSVTCGTPAASALTLIPGKGIQIKQPQNASGTAPTSIIIVGSHNPTLSLTVPKAGIGQIGNFWFGVPYHTTAVTAQDLCLSTGITNTGLINKAIVTRMNASTGTPATATCTTSAASALNLVLGEFVQLRDPQGPRTFIPAHF